MYKNNLEAKMKIFHVKHDEETIKQGTKQEDCQKGRKFAAKLEKEELRKKGDKNKKLKIEQKRFVQNALFFAIWGMFSFTNFHKKERKRQLSEFLY